MKYIKRNWFNKLFHRSKFDAQAREYDQLCMIERAYMGILNDLYACNTLTDMMYVHKKAWKMGFKNDNLGPCPYGMFRCENIETMNEDEVFLGNIYGLWTFPISKWEKWKDKTMAGNGWGLPSETKVYDLIMNQYRSHLRSNFKKIANACHDKKVWMQTNNH